MTSVFVEGRALYIHGGQYAEGSTSVPTTSQPNYTLMTTEGPTDYRLTSALLTDNNGWLMISNATGSKLRVDNLAWSEVSFGPAIMSTDRGLAMATDPTTGSIYIINGGLSNGVKQTFTYNEALNQYKEIGQTVPMESGFAGAWTIARKSMLIHGGVKANVLQAGLYEFLPSNTAPLIQPVVSSGDIPTARQGHCMVSAYGGTKMIVFGGIGTSNAALSDIYILDSMTLKWTKGTDGGATVARAYTACAVTNDMFVAWGGCDGSLTTLTNNIMVIYNLKTNQWTSSFSPLPYTGPLTPTGTVPPTASGSGKINPTSDSNSQTSENASSGSNLGAIVGGVVGGLVFIGLIVGLVIFRRRQQAKANNALSTQPNLKDHDKGGIEYLDTSNNNTFIGHSHEKYPDNEVSVSAVVPQYSIFQPTVSTAEAQSQYQLAYIDHHHQQHQQQGQPSLQYNNPQTIPFAPSPVTSVRTTTTLTSTGSPPINYATKPAVGNEDLDGVIQPVVRHPHTPGDSQTFKSVSGPHTYMP
ncbi:hypothetical protein FBU30_002679 [Linnemannia zychae]|nr:hypothetical protein FBU30_002679 [Linnemannia zychae]